MATKMHLKTCPNCKLQLRFYDNYNKDITRYICPGCNIIMTYDNFYSEAFTFTDYCKK